MNVSARLAPLFAALLLITTGKTSAVPSPFRGVQSPLCRTNSIESFCLGLVTVRDAVKKEAPLNAAGFASAMEEAGVVGCTERDIHAASRLSSSYCEKLLHNDTHPDRPLPFGFSVHGADIVDGENLGRGVASANLELPYLSRGWFRKIGRKIKGAARKVSNGVRSVGRKARGALKKAANGVRRTGRKIRGGFKKLGRNVRRGLGKLGRNIGRGARKLGNNIKRGVQKLSSKVRGIGRKLRKGIKRAHNWVAERLRLLRKRGDDHLEPALPAPISPDAEKAAFDDIYKKILSSTDRAAFNGLPIELQDLSRAVCEEGKNECAKFIHEMTVLDKLPADVRKLAFNYCKTYGGGCLIHLPAYVTLAALPEPSKEAALEVCAFYIKNEKDGDQLCPTVARLFEDVSSIAPPIRPYAVTACEHNPEDCRTILNAFKEYASMPPAVGVEGARLCSEVEAEYMLKACKPFVPLFARIAELPADLHTLAASRCREYDADCELLVKTFERLAKLKQPNYGIAKKLCETDINKCPDKVVELLLHGR